MSDHDQYFNNSLVDEYETELFNDESSKESEELLIDAVRAYPHLYSHQDKNFKDLVMKENSWKEISIAVHMPVAECKTRWTRLRERFGKEKRQKELDSRSDSGASKRVGFVYYENLLFLDDHIKRRKVYTNISSKRLNKTEANGTNGLTAVPSTSSTLEEDLQIKNDSNSYQMVENMETLDEPLAPSTQTELTNSVDPQIRPATNFRAPFRKKMQERIEQKSSINVASEQGISPAGSSSRRQNDLIGIFDDSEDSRSSGISGREYTPSPAPPTCQSTPQRPPVRRKKSDTTALETTLLSLCQSVHQSLQNDRLVQVAETAGDTFAKLIVTELDKLPPQEQKKRQLAIMQILYAPYP